MHNNTRPDPKKYASYEEYLHALEIHEKFISLASSASKVISESASEKEFLQGMEALGFSYHDDEYCENNYCIENEECLMCTLDYYSEEYNKHYFGNLLPQEQLLVQTTRRLYEAKNGCGLPPAWHNPTCVEHKTILWFLKIQDACNEENLLNIFSSEVVSKKEFQDFFRSLYLFLASVLHNQKRKDQWVQKIEIFLNNNTILSKKSSEDLLLQLSEILHILV